MAGVVRRVARWPSWKRVALKFAYLRHSIGGMTIDADSNFDDDALSILRTAEDNQRVLVLDQRDATNNPKVLYINNAGSGNTIETDDGAKLTAAGAWTDAASYERYKTPVGQLANVLDKVKGLTVDVWEYKNEVVDGKNRYLADQNRHCQPYLDHFHSVFELGAPDGVTPMDHVGVLYCAVKELIDRIDALEGEPSSQSKRKSKSGK